MPFTSSRATDIGRDGGGTSADSDFFFPELSSPLTSPGFRACWLEDELPRLRDVDRFPTSWSGLSLEVLRGVHRRQRPVHRPPTRASFCSRRWRY
jgi:hypothetical protein